MICDKCEHQAKFYHKVVLPDQGERYWCPSCVDGVPSGVEKPLFEHVSYGFKLTAVAPTYEEFLKDENERLSKKLVETEENLRMAHKHNRGLGSNNQLRKAEIAKLMQKINRLERDGDTQALAIRNHVKENEKLVGLGSRQSN